MHTNVEVVAVGAAGGGSGSSNTESVLLCQESLINSLSSIKHLIFSTHCTKHVEK